MDKLQGINFGFCFFQSQLAGVVGVEFLDCDSLDVAFGEVFVVVEGAVVGGNAVEVAQVFGLGAFFFGEECLVHLFAVADADDFDVVFIAAKEFADCLCLSLDGAGGGFLDKDVSVLAVLEGEKNEVYGFVKGHDEAGHGGLGDGDGLAVLDLVYPKGDYGAAGAHDVAVAGAANPCAQGVAALGYGYLLLEGLADTHCINWVGSFVRGEADDALDALFYGGVKDVVSADYVGLDSFHGEEFATGNLLEGGGVEDVIYAMYCGL